MNLTSIAATASSLLSLAANSASSTSVSSSGGTLDQQKAALQKQITAENQSNDDAQTKAQKLQDYNKQLQKIEQELEQQSSSDDSSATAALLATPSGSPGNLVDITV